MFANFYLFIKNEEYTRVTAAKPQVFSANTSQKEVATEKSEKKSHARGKSRDTGGKSTSKANYQSVPVGGSQVYDIQEHGYNTGSKKLDNPSGSDVESEKGYWHKNEDSDTEDPRRPYKQLKHVFEIKVKELKNIPILNKFICQSNNMSEPKPKG